MTRTVGYVEAQARAGEAVAVTLRDVIRTFDFTLVLIDCKYIYNLMAL